MKKLLFVSVFFLMNALLYAQVLQAINFQAIARDGSGNPMVSTNIQIRLSVIDSAQGGIIVYQELRALQTNAYGSFSFQIGVGANFTTIGTFQGIDWASGNKHLKIDYDPTNTFTFSLTLGVIKFVTVPYAFAAQEVVFIDATGAQNGDALIYNSTSGKFEPGQVSAGTVDWADVQNKPTLDGSETKVQAGTNVTVTGSGTTASPYIINVTGGGIILLPPTATTLAASNVQGSATLNGTVNANGLTTTVAFEWGLTTSYGNNLNANPNLVTGTTDVAVNANLTGGLLGGNTYHYRIKAINAANITYSNDMTVTILDTIPPVITYNTMDRVAQFGSSFPDTTVTAIDNVDGIVTVSVTGSVNMNVSGSYILVYTATDNAGNLATINRTVTVDGGLYLAGSFTVEDFTGSTSNGTYAETISASSVIYNKILFTRFAFYNNAAVYGTLSGNTITIPAQSVVCGYPIANRSFSGSGTYNSSNHNFTINYVEITNGTTYTGHGVYTMN